MTVIFQVYGGNNFLVRVYRTYFKAKSTLISRWRGNPVLTIVLIGLPFGFLCFILYSCCCADILDAEGDDDESKYLNTTHVKFAIVKLDEQLKKKFYLTVKIKKFTIVKVLL